MRDAGEEFLRGAQRGAEFLDSLARRGNGACHDGAFRPDDGEPRGEQLEDPRANVPPQGEEAQRSTGDIRVGGALTLAASVPDPRYTMSPLFLRGKLGTMTAHPGHGKTTVMVGACVALALDRAFGPLAPVEGGHVYVVSAEDIEGTRNRIYAEAARLRLTPGEREELDRRLRWAHVEGSASLREILAAIERDAAGAEIALIFVDTGPALFPGDDENDNVALRNFAEGLRTLTTLAGGPCVVVAWHPAKGATSDRLEPRGASAIKGTIDFNLTLWRDDDSLSLHYTKLRGPAFEPIEGKLSTLDIETPAGARFPVPVATLAAVEEIVVRSEARVAREAILRRLFLASAPLSVRDIAKAINLGKSPTHRHMQGLRAGRSPLVERDPVADGYLLTKAGKERARELPQQGASYADVRG